MARLFITLLVPCLLQGNIAAPSFTEAEVHEYALPLKHSLPSPYNEDLAPPDGFVQVGDMLVPQSLYQQHFDSPLAYSRKGVSHDDVLWPRENGTPTVPYEIIDDIYKIEIEAGMKHWEEHTCLTFRPRQASDKYWLRFIYDDGCWSWIGRWLADVGQEVSIGKGCQKLSIVVHEIGHAIGLFHEQMRSDRDDYVVINWHNILSDQQSNFFNEPNIDDNRNVPYDYTSIMHYKGRDFSSNGRTTIATKLPQHQGLLGRSQQLTHRDKHIVNLMYGCIDEWQTQCKSAESCVGEGYLGRGCTCVCSPGQAGDRCEVYMADYYNEFLPTCTTTITEEINFTTPNYPGNIPSDTWCVYTIEAPDNMVPEVIFHSFRLMFVSQYSSCVDFLEVRNTNPHDGKVYCRTDIKQRQSFVSNSTHLYLYLETFTSKSEGFYAEVVFHNATNTVEPNPGGVRSLVPSTVLVVASLLMVPIYIKSW